MTSTITTHTLDWRGILIQVRYQRQTHIDHLQIETLEPARAPLPMTETGYRSHFLAHGIVQDHGGPLNFVQGWLDDAASAGGWIEAEASARQGCLF